MSVSAYAYFFFGSKLLDSIEYDDLEEKYAMAVHPEARISKGQIKLDWRQVNDIMRHSGCEFHNFEGTGIYIAVTASLSKSDDINCVDSSEIPLKEFTPKDFDGWTHSVVQMSRAIACTCETPRWHFITTCSY